MLKVQNKDSNRRVDLSTLHIDFIIDKVILIILILSLLVFILLPTLKVITTSIYENGTFSLKQYSNLLDAENLKLVKNSLFVSILSSVFATIISFCIALYVFLLRGKKKKLCYYSLMLTMISPPFVSALALIILFGRRGLITYGIMGLSVNPYGWQGIVLLQTIGQVSFASIMLISAFNNMDLRQVLASRDLGATPIQTLRYIVLPAMAPAIMSVLFILFTMNLADFGTPIVIGGKFKVLATEAYMRIISSGDLGKASAISVLLLPPAIIAFYFYRKNMLKMNNSSDGTKSISNSSYEFKLPKPIRIFLAIVTGLFFGVMILKYGNIFLSAISNTSSGKIKFTLQNFRDIRAEHIGSFWRSILFSISAGILSSIIGVLLSYYTNRRKIVGMKYMEFISALPYIIPGIFFGLGYVIAFNNKPLLLTGTAIIVILNCTFRHITVSNKAANVTFANMDYKIEDAARDLGASRIRILLDIVFPMLAPAFLTSFITTFTACMTTIGAIVFLISPGKLVASVVMFNVIQNGQYGLGSVMACALIIVTVGVNIIAIRVLNKRQEV